MNNPGLRGVPFFNQNVVRRNAGHFIITEPDAPTVEGDSLVCTHCGVHWLVIPGSGRTRGFCRHCNDVTCGAPACMVHDSKLKQKLVDEGIVTG
jgi:hypothetical protein